MTHTETETETAPATRQEVLTRMMHAMAEAEEAARQSNIEGVNAWTTVAAEWRTISEIL